MRKSSDFRGTIRTGVRAARPTLVVHARLLDATSGDRKRPGTGTQPNSTHNSPPNARVGFVVSKAVGNAVTRNRVKRRLRHLVAPLVTVPAAGAQPREGLQVVVRALPAAAEQPERLAQDLEGAWAKALSRLGVDAMQQSAGAGR